MRPCADRLVAVALLLILAAALAPAHAFELAPQRVAEGVYALIGPTGPRTYQNYGLNDNLGFVVTGQGVLLIDSGATVQSGPLIERAVHSVTDQPVRWVVNTGSQDHRWLGNAYFADRGAKLIALARTVRTQRQYGGEQLAALRRVLKERANGTRPVSAPRPLSGNRARLTLGGVVVELHWFGDAHFPGDAVVWLPQSKVLFSGDLIYVDRMLGVMPSSHTVSWRQAFHRAMDTLDPRIIVPGHGAVCDAAKARRDTGDYLDWLVAEVQPAVERWDGLEGTVQRLGRAKRWAYLEHFDTLHRNNINRTFVQLENGQTGETP
jgi:glyoxylase-like metal-dependent hydrolase (beta-lactamase superfamily II)